MSMMKSKESLLNDKTIIEIFLHLPVKSLVRFSCVCKSWKKFIFCNEDFVRSHLNRATKNGIEVLMYSNEAEGDQDDICFQNYDLQSVNDQFMRPRKSTELPTPLCVGENFKIAGYWDGIVCCYKQFSTSIYLLNLALHQCRTIPTKGEYNPIYHDDFMGFCYDPHKIDYKIVKLSSGRITKGELFSLKRNSWKLIPIDFSCHCLTYVLKWEYSDVHPLSFNGCLHWIGEISTQEHDKEKNDAAIVVFDICDEKLKLFKIPNSISTSIASFACLGVFKGCMSFISTANQSEWEVWSMKVHGVPESWMRTTIIDLELIKYSHFIGFSAENEKLLLLKEAHSVLSYDLKSSRCSQLFDLTGDTTTYDHCFVADYVETLISVMPSPPSERNRNKFCSYFLVLFVILALLFYVVWLLQDYL